jgi:hypothetical protein
MKSFNIITSAAAITALATFATFTPTTARADGPQAIGSDNLETTRKAATDVQQMLK